MVLHGQGCAAPEVLGFIEDLDFKALEGKKDRRCIALKKSKAAI